MNWNWARQLLAPLDAFLYKRRVEQLERITEHLMLQVLEAGKEPLVNFGEGANMYVRSIRSRVAKRWRESEAEIERLTRLVVMVEQGKHGPRRKPRARS